jgi:hypothetical protein
MNWNSTSGKLTASRPIHEPLMKIIGRLVYDGRLNKFFVDRFYGSKHYKTRAAAEAILERYKSIFRL